MDKVWVVEQGCYSDYRVVGVFSSRKNAKLIADAINAAEQFGDKASIAEWSLNPAVKELNAGYSQFIVNMLRDGTVERVSPLETCGYQMSGSVRIWERTKASAYKGKGIPDCLDATVWAKDAQHAVKIVNEHRTQMIATGKWKEQPHA